MNFQHIILGTGNLGTALLKKFEQTERVYVYNRPVIEDIITLANLCYDENEEEIEKLQTIVWNTEGYGSVPECQKNPREAFEVHVMRNLDLMHGLHRNINLINFSTNYVGNDPKSEYTSSKTCMEALTKSFPREKIITVRVANLYSKYFPLKSFQGKILKNADKITTLPSNGMMPTDCDWLANQLCEIINKIDEYQGQVIQIAPSWNGMVSANEFGKYILGKEIAETLDKSRPEWPNISNDLDCWDNWLKVWQDAKPEFMKEYNRIVNDKL